MSDTSGPTSYAPFARWDRDSQSWRTSEATSLWALTLSSLTLPQWGGLRDGELCEHPTPALATSVLDCSSLPTPSANDTTGAEDQAQRKIRGAGGPMLRDLPTLLPTPAVNDMGRGKTPEDWDAWTAKMQAAHGNGNGHGKSLEIEAQRLLPTPRSTDGTDAPANLTPSVQAICDGSAGRTPRLSEMAVGNLLPTPTSQAAKHGETPALGPTFGTCPACFRRRRDATTGAPISVGTRPVCMGRLRPRHRPMGTRHRTTSPSTN